MHFCTKGSNVSPLKDRVMQLCSILIHYAAVIPIMITVMQADDLTLSCLWGPHLLTKKQLALSFCLQAYLTYTSIVALYWTLESQKRKKQEPLVCLPQKVASALIFVGLSCTYSFMYLVEIRARFPSKSRICWIFGKSWTKKLYWCCIYWLHILSCQESVLNQRSTLSRNFGCTVFSILHNMLDYTSCQIVYPS